MDMRAGDAIVAHRSRTPASDASLVSLEATALSARFHAWRGASEHRYVTSVYAFDASSQDHGLPSFDACVLVPVRFEGGQHRPLAIVAVERASDWRYTIANALARGVDAWHVHLLGADRRARAAVVADLTARHGVAKSEVAKSEARSA